MTEEEYFKLIHKYLDGTISGDERNALLNWYREKAERESEWVMESPDEEQQLHDRVLKTLKVHIAEDRSGRGFKRNFRMIAAAAVVVLVSALFISREYLINLIDPVKFATVKTGPGERMTVRLSDGSVVWLSPKSSLRYPQEFRGALRETAVEGEAFFEVAKNKEHPFIVRTGGVCTKVLGTSFNIQSYSGRRNICVTLLTGRVAFSDGRNEIDLIPNQRAIFDKNERKMSKMDFPDARLMLERRSGRLEYLNAPVFEIIEDLKSMYDVDIEMDEQTRNCRFFGRFKEKENLDKFLRKLCLIIGADIRMINNKTYKISGGGCAMSQ